MPKVLAAAKRGMILINTARGPGVTATRYTARRRITVLPEELANSQQRLVAAWQMNEEWIRHRPLLTPRLAFYAPESMRDNRAFAVLTAARFQAEG